MVLPFLYFYKYNAERRFPGVLGVSPNIFPLWNDDGKGEAHSAFFLSDIVPTMGKLAVPKTVFSKITATYGQKTEIRRKKSILAVSDAS